MQLDEVRKELKRWGFNEVSHKTSFHAYRETKQGGAYRVSIDILDSGEEGHSRYHCFVTREDGKIAKSNPASSVKEAIGIVHWEDLDK